MYIASTTKLFQSILPGTFWNTEILGNTLSAYLLALILFLILWAIFALLRQGILKFLSSLAKKTPFDLDDTFIEILQSFRSSLYIFFSLYVALRTFLTLSGMFGEILNAILLVLIIYEVVESAYIFVHYIVKKHLMDADDPGVDSMSKMLGIIARVVLWAVGILLLLANFGFEITPILAGLGVAGLAIGLALQPVLSDLFASFSIYFDKPFRIGDFIGVNGNLGTVKQVGVKTTRITSLSGEELVMSNSMLSDATINNYSVREKRRVVFAVGVMEDTPIEKVKKISHLLETIIKKQTNVEFDRSWFQKFGESSFDFEAVYYVDSPDYIEYATTQEKINVEIVDLFAKEAIELSYPVRVVYQPNTDPKESGEKK